VGRARERVKLSEMRQGVCAGHWRGSKKGAGRASWPRNLATCASAHAPVHGKREGAELTGQAHGGEREERGMRGNDSATGWPHWAASEGGRARAREHGRTGWLSCFILFFFSEFSNSFSISFSIGFSNPNSN
jgi:hypothetical protein